MNLLEKKNNHDIIIFKTDEDRTGISIEKMSDFFGNYIEEMSLVLKENNKFEKITKMPFSDLSILADVIQNVEIAVKGNITLVPDFENLPRGIKSKLKKGIYKIGESKQVDGNLRAVIVNENNERVKDITLKKIKTNDENINTLNNIATQLQLKQIYTQLNELSELQTYQIEIDRNRDLIVPFLDAREFVLKAELKNDFNERKSLLNEADIRITTAIHAIYTDLETTSKLFAKELENPLSKLNGNVENAMKYLVQDLQLVTKYNGVKLQLLDYMEEYQYKEQAMKMFKSVLNRFITNPISKKGLSAIELLQNYYPYNKSNMNFWEKFKENVEVISNPSIKQQMLDKFKNNKKYLYTVSVEDCENES